VKLEPPPPRAPPTTNDLKFSGVPAWSEFLYWLAFVSGHRCALLEDDPPDEFPLELPELQEKYRWASADGNTRWMRHLADVFEIRVKRLS
jgi:hypothetical protein